MKTKKLIYLASPYSNPNSEIRKFRVKRVCECARDLLEQGYSVFSPIAHSHQIGKDMVKGHLNYDLWREVDFKVMTICDLFVFCKLPGCENLRGVEEELREASRLGKELKIGIYDKETGRWELREPGWKT